MEDEHGHLPSGEPDSVLLGHRDRQRIKAVLWASACFSDLVETAGLNPATDFRFADLSGVDFRGSDLRRYDFTSANLSGTRWFAARWDDTTVLTDAVLDGVHGYSRPESFDPARGRDKAGPLGGAHTLLRRLREVMAEPVSAQGRLDNIVVLIAANTVAEVCSVYVLRVDATLELYATEGLNREAVHNTVMRSDEGLVGLVAKEANPINLSDAQRHPAYSYRPETGEEIYHSFLGVPILRAGNTLGVLVVQNRARRTYSEEEVEALQTTAIVLAEMIASGELSALAPPGAAASGLGAQ